MKRGWVGCWRNEERRTCGVESGEEDLEGSARDVGIVPGRSERAKTRRVSSIRSKGKHDIQKITRTSDAKRVP